MSDNKHRFELSQRFYFEAAHTLHRKIETEGSLRIHGHTYEAEATLVGTPDPDSGMLMDLGYFRNEIEKVRSMLDHHFLDEVEGLGAATLENLCLFIMNKLKETIPNISCVLVERKASGDKSILRLN